MVHIFNYCYRKKVNSVVTSLYVIVKSIDISSISEKLMLFNIIKDYRSMMCNI